ncbi:hypothetical protein RHSIM_Rhsim02G0220300 [Rhododendron simsii]|uniref:PB1-like domain-containing protein n=1 Tax=Rhododendron simsii TaxID=118357 RepID=A0A834HLW0_RHOSS|nr:hypothetical protein RHSIM_Rhsim02G0220300 [Rhododendron simsii]
MYLGGTVEMVDEIDPDLICYFDLKRVIMSYGYPTTSSIYYLIPGVGLTKGLRVLNSDIEVREMLDVYKGLPVICLYCEKGPEPLQIIYPDEVDVPHVETNVVHLDDESPKTNEGNHEVVVDIPVDKGISDDEDEEDDPDYVGDEEDEEDEGDEDEDEDDGSDVSSNPSWMYENMEGPGDDDIFASKEQQNQAKDDKKQPEIEDWYSDGGNSNELHTITYKNHHVTSQYIASKYLDKLRDDPCKKVDAFQKQVRRELTVDVSKGKLYRAKRTAKEMIEGDHSVQYGRLNDYVETILKFNPSSWIKIQSDKPSPELLPTFCRIDTYLGVYHHMIHPIPGKHDWEKSNQEEIRPPFMRRPSGRPRKARRKAAEEVEDTGTETLSRAERYMSCAKCLQRGHNVRSCKNPIHPNSNMLKKKDLPSRSQQEQKGQPKQKKSRTTAPKTSTQPSVDAGFYTKPPQSFAPINPGFYTQPNQGSANCANPGFSSQPSKLQCIGGKFGGSGPKFSVGVANSGGRQTSGGQRGGGKTGASRGGGRSTGPRGGGRSGATRGGGRVGATRGGRRAGATRGGGRAGGPRASERSGAVQTGSAHLEGGEAGGREGDWWW